MAPILDLEIVLNGLSKTVKFPVNITELSDSYQQIMGGGYPEIIWQMSTAYKDYSKIDEWINLLEQYGGFLEFDLMLDFLGQKTFRCIEFSKEKTHHDYGNLSLTLVQSL